MLKYDKDPIKHPAIYDNKKGITNLEDLLEVESYYEAIRHTNLLFKPAIIKGNFDKKHYLDIHKYLFQDIYPWAGELRDGDISKDNTLFCLTQFIDDEFARFQKSITNFDISKASKEDVAKHIAKVSDDLNAIHPCREGNGRTKRAFTELYAFHLGYELDYSKYDTDTIKEAEINAFRTGDISNLAKIMGGALTCKKEIKESGKFDNMKASEVIMAKIKSEDTKKTFEKLLSGEDIFNDKSRSEYQLLNIVGIYSKFDTKTMAEVFNESKLSAGVTPVQLQQKIHFVTETAKKVNVPKAAKSKANAQQKKGIQHSEQSR